MLVRHEVRDFSVWRRIYDAHLSKRVEAGLSEKYIFRGTDDSGEIFILFEARDIARAKAFAGAPELRERMEEAGVIGTADIYFLKDESGKVSASLAVRDDTELKRIEEFYAKPSEKEVEVEFIYLAPRAKEVNLAGNFNNWDAKSLPMKKNKKGQWKAAVRLLPGRYEYRYFADGSWITDKQCTEVVRDKTGSAKCVIDVAPKMAA